MYLIGFLVLPLIGLLFNFQLATASSVRPLVQDEKEKYNLRIEASQWEHRAFDLNAIENELGRPLKIVDFEKKSDVRPFIDTFARKHKIGVTGDTSKSFAKNAIVNLKIYTTDVQHGLSINEVNIAVSTNRPASGETWGDVSLASFTTPNEDATFSAFCQIFCGLGHPDMKIKIVIGEGSFEFGPIVFWSAISVNGIILVIQFFQMENMNFGIIFNNHHQTCVKPSFRLLKEILFSIVNHYLIYGMNGRLQLES